MNDNDYQKLVHDLTTCYKDNRTADFISIWKSSYSKLTDCQQVAVHRKLGTIWKDKTLLTSIYN